MFKRRHECFVIASRIDLGLRLDSILSQTLIIRFIGDIIIDIRFDVAIEVLLRRRPFGFGGRLEQLLVGGCFRFRRSAG